MATQTLAEAAKLINNQIVQGVAEDIITTNPMWAAMPWTGYEGQAILVNRENALGDAQHLAVGGAITAKAAATFTQITFSATTTIGDAEINGLVAAQSSGAGVDLRTQQSCTATNKFTYLKEKMPKYELL